MNNDEVYDITIIGGGPAGMFAGFYAGLRNAKTQIIESLAELGGQVATLYPEKTILDVAGYPQIKGRELIAQLEQQLQTVATEVKLNTTVQNIKQVGDAFEVITNNGMTVSKSIIIATGVGAFNPRKLAVDNSDEFEGTNLFYSVKDLDHFKNRTVLVAGGGDAAIDEALLIESVAKQVYLLHRRDKFRAMEHSVDLLTESTVETVTPYLISELASEGDQVKITAKKMKSDEEMSMVVDDIVVNYGFIAQDDALSGWEVHPEGSRGKIHSGVSGITNIKNVFTIGDVADYETKQALIATGFGEAPLAVNEAMRSIYPDRRGPVHSTSIKR
ncbi:NAD(P)/FAD-dependent oxidoreductase [Lentilactobacillus kosonis]|uniref:Ferredoxin--NADP reductase n=1 Tax=Lentilactobacillus kosonis TaxID=2810561 RepID=A0A401FIP5_9LACO|nr:NAD(P)/FAD-dependent oxidoreductase [Lentilactobacillus kosonis]GAY72131.1 thioredoxin reductase [Lentilactobacillus kosonis]